MIKPTLVIPVLTLLLASSCLGPKAISTIESNSYDDKTNQTTLHVLPLGSMSLPGKWEKFRYSEVSAQHGFKNVDSVSTALAINQASNYPFYKAKMSSNQIVKEMYEWDSSYWVAQLKGSRTLLKEDTTQHFAIWQLQADNKYKVDNYYLLGCEKGIVFTVFINTKKWSLTQKLEFLETVYKSKNVGTCCN